MTIKRILLFIPFILTVFLLQSYFWVPTYENQAAGNPNRLVTYIEGSAADAKILNPILNADLPSAIITNHMFEGLLDLDEDLKLRGRLATDWAITEKAYLLVRDSYRFPDGKPVTGQELVRRLTRRLNHRSLADVRSHVISIRLLPPEERNEVVSLMVKDEDGNPSIENISLSINVPERIEFVLDHVDQDLFRHLAPVVGEWYWDDVAYDQYVSIQSEIAPELQSKLEAKFPKLLPVSEHNPHILFHLRKGVRFHDGHEFDAGDVKFTYDAIMDSKNLSPRTSNFEPIKSVEVVDAHTVNVVYKRLYSPAIDAWTMGILPEHLLNQEAMNQEMQERELSEEAQANFGMRDSLFNRQPIGSGRFQFVDWQGDEFIQLQRFEAYWDGPAEYHEYYMRVIPDLLTQEMEFLSGAIDYYVAQPHQVARYKDAPSYQSFSSMGFAYTYIGYNNRKPLFAEAKIRRALGMAVNVKDFLKYVVYGEGKRTTGPYSQNTEWYDQTIEPLPYDPQRALELFEEMGWRKNADGWLEKDGKLFEFNLITNSGNPIRQNIMTIVQNAWKKIGVKCRTQYFEWTVFLKDFVNTGEFDAVVLGWSMDINPDLYQIWHSSQAGPQQLNFVGYRNPRADELIVRIRQEYNRDRQRKFAHQLHQIIHDDQPYTFLYAPLTTLVLDKKIVLVDKDENGAETYSKIYPTKSGDVSVYFHKWRKLAFTPDF
ncbi:ABC transporter substrate-binding protein [Candidatus Nitrospira salsa]